MRQISNLQHLHFMCAFFVLKFVQSQTLSREKLLKRLLYKKYVRKMLMKLTPVVLNIWLQITNKKQKKTHLDDSFRAYTH